MTFEEAKYHARKEGFEEGFRIGFQKGFKKGFQIGYQKGLQKARAEREQKLREIGMPESKIKELLAD